jgi:hypothetical protein
MEKKYRVGWAYSDRGRERWGEFIAQFEDLLTVECYDRLFF